MRGSEVYNRCIDTIIAVNRIGRVETVIRQFQSETMPSMRTPCRKLRDDMTAELKSRLKGLPDGRAREALSLATTLISTLMGHGPLDFYGLGMRQAA